MDDDKEVDCMVTAPKACGAFLDVGPPVLCIPKLGTNNY